MSTSTPIEEDRALEFGPFDRSWTRRDCIVYALGVGAGTEELAFTTDTTRDHPQQAIPTFAINMGLGGRGFDLSALGDPRRMVHAGHRLVLHASVPTRGAVRTRGAVTETVPKGSGRLVTVEWTSSDRTTGVRLFTNVVSYFVREPDGAGESRPSRYDLGGEIPDAEPSAEVAEATLPIQALLYRCSGDPNLIHTDPVVARKAGFRGPILHGLCTLGFAARALLRSVCDGDPGRFGAIECRFSAPGYPGDTLVTEIWRGPGGAAFRTRNQEGTVLLDRGLLTLVVPPPAGEP